MRISYRSDELSGSMSAVWALDPDGPWVDQGSGDHYSERLPSPPGADQAGAGTSGATEYVQYDVLAVKDAGIAYESRHYSVVGGTLEWDDGASQWEPDGTIDGVSVSFDQLKLWQQVSGIGQVLTGKVKIAGITFQALALIDSFHAQPSARIYDLKTGLLLQRLDFGDESDVPIANDAVVPLYEYSLANLRQIDRIGAHGVNPAWVGTAGQLTFRGSYTAAPHNGTTPQTASMTMIVGYQELADELMSYEVLWVSGQTTVSDQGIAGPFGPYWLDPASLAGLRPATVLDTDPITGATVTVGTAPAGQVALQATDGSYRVTRVYDVHSGSLEQEKTEGDSGTIVVTVEGA